MSSFNQVNFSQRASKSIHRELVFDSLHVIYSALAVERFNYVGLGSLWFSDFISAAKRFKTERLVSLEWDKIGAVRANFNRPFDSIEVICQTSSDFLASDDWSALCNESIPNVVWFDYDEQLSARILSDACRLATTINSDSIILLTLNIDREFTAAGGFPGYSCEHDNSRAIIERTIGTALIKRPELSVTRFCDCIYFDSVNMLTIGFVVTHPHRLDELQGIDKWPAILDYRIKSPILTLKEIAALRRFDFQNAPVSRDAILEIGFDLESDQINTLNRHMRF